MFRKFFQVLAFFFPSPVNIWFQRLAGAQIGRHVSIHPGVLILAKKVQIRKEAKIKFGTMINVRTFGLGRKSSIGFFTLAKGVSDLIVGDASIIGPRCMINCDREVTLGYYSGVGPGCYLYTHGSGLPVIEGYRAAFGPIHIKDKVWVSMRCVIGPGVTIETGTNIMPGTVLVENVAAKRVVVGNPAKLNDFPVFLIPRKPDFCEELAPKILKEYRSWSNEYKGTNWQVEDGVLKIPRGNRNFSISINGDGDIALLTRRGEIRDGMYFNLAHLTTDEGRHPEKSKFEAFLRLHYGLIFLEKETG
jgi:acetyltransferase-like isoleucine patch superfamily enzyme